MTKHFRSVLHPTLSIGALGSHASRRQMCELWQSQIYDSSSDGVTADILAAMNRVTLDIVGLAGETSPSLPRPVITRRLDCWTGS